MIKNLRFICLAVAFVLFAAGSVRAQQLEMSGHVVTGKNCSLTLEGGKLVMNFTYDMEQMNQFNKLNSLGYAGGGASIWPAITIANVLLEGPDIKLLLTVDEADPFEDQPMNVLMELRDLSGKPYDRKQVVLSPGINDLSQTLLSRGLNRANLVLTLINVKRLIVGGLTLQ
jgi:hypothetical protein